MRATNKISLPLLQDEVSLSEWETGVDLAACYRPFDLYGPSAMPANHISARVLGENAFLINPYGMLYEEITVSSLIKISKAGEAIAFRISAS